jgi:transposase
MNIGKERIMSEISPASEPEYAAFVAIDWADREHAWALEVAGSGKREKGRLKHSPETIQAWAVGLAVRFGGRPIAVGLEQSRGALIYALQPYAHLVLYPIHPTTSSRYRAAVFPSGGKDDPQDAELLLDLLVRHRDRLRAWQPDTEETRKLQALTEKRRQLVDELTAQSNRMKDLLKMYFPQVLEWLDELSSPLGVAFLQRWPSLQQLQKQDAEVIRKFFYEHGSRSRERIEERLAAIQKARPALEDRAVIDPCVLMVQALLPVVTALRQGIGSLQEAIEGVFGQHPDAAIFASFPGAAQVMAPRLLAAFGSQRNRWDSLSDFQNYSGIPPVTVRSGTSQWIHFRWACPKFLRQTFHEYAGLSIQQSEWARAFYDHQRQVKRLDHHAAVRSLAYKWQRILYRCWKNQIPYQESVYQEQLQRRSGSTGPTPSSQRARSADQRTAQFSPARSRNSTDLNPVHFQFKKVAGFWKLAGATS